MSLFSLSPLFSEEAEHFIYNILPITICNHGLMYLQIVQWETLIFMKSTYGFTQPGTHSVCTLNKLNLLCETNQTKLLITTNVKSAWNMGVSDTRTWSYGWSQLTNYIKWEQQNIKERRTENFYALGPWHLKQVALRD
jgi:hypothetical protein